MFINGDAGAEIFNACTRLFNGIVAFSDADLNDIEHPWGGNSTVYNILNLLIFWDYLLASKMIFFPVDVLSIYSPN